MRLFVVLVLALVLVACGGRNPPPPPVPVLVEALPEGTADGWSEKAREHLQAKRYREAFEAARKALHLDSRHGLAQYYAGMARLELGETCLAIDNLWAAYSSQPGWESAVGLSRGLAATFNASRSAYFAARAESLGAPPAELQAALTAQAALRMGNRPADLEKGARGKLVDGNVTLYVYREPEMKGCFGRVYTLYAITGDGKHAKLPLGSFRDDEGTWRLTRADHTGNAVRYWLRMPSPSSLGLAEYFTWLLIQYQGGRLDSIQFTGFDGVNSEEQPVITDQTVTAVMANPDGSASTWTTRYTLSGSPPAGAFSDIEEQAWGEVTAIGGSISLQLRARRADFLPGALTFTRSLNGKVEVLKNGEPVPLTEVKVGSTVMVRNRQRNGMTIVID